MRVRIKLIIPNSRQRFYPNLEDTLKQRLPVCNEYVSGNLLFKPDLGALQKHIGPLEFNFKYPEIELLMKVNSIKMFYEGKMLRAHF